MSRRRNSGRRRGRNKRPSLFILCMLVIFVMFGVFGYAASLEPALPVDLEAGEVAVHFIDVGQGDSVLVQTGEGHVLIDGGDRHMGERVVQYLYDAGVRELTYVIATHPHADHIGGLIEVLHSFPVETLIMPPVAHTTRTFERFLDAIEAHDIPLKAPVAGESFSLGGGEFTIIAPNASGYQKLNDYSVSLRLVVGETSFIFTGDAEAESEMEMIQAGHVLSSDVLHLGHHGSSTSTTQAFFDAVDPSIAVISLGRDNQYGHPHREVRERLSGIPVYRTDEDGHILLVTDGVQITVRRGNQWLSWVPRLMQLTG